MTSLGFIGIGTMGAPMAARLVSAGHAVRIRDVVPTAGDALVDAGATRHDSAAEAADGTEVTFLSLPGPDEIRSALTGPHGVLAAGRKPPIVVDLSTNAVTTTRELRAEAAAHGVSYLDAPVSGGVAKAADGTLAVLVGAEPDELRCVRGLLEAIGTEVIHVGPPGSGAVAKLVNNQIFLAGAALVQEAYVLAQALGLDPAATDAVLTAGSAAPYVRLAPLLLSRRFDDVIFRLDIAAKDLRLAVHGAREAGIDVPLASAAADLYQSACESGHATEAFHATLREFERRAGIELVPLRRAKPTPAADRPTTGAPT